MNKREAKRKFPVFLTALLLCLWVQLPAPAYGSGSVGGEPLEDAQETDVVFPRIQGTRDVKTELMGNIEVSLISVTMPSDGFEFQIKPDHSFDAVTNPGGQILCPGPDSLKITNHSVVPVSVEIASVESLRDGDVVFQKKFTEGPEQRFRLVDRLADVKGYGTALLVLGKAGKSVMPILNSTPSAREKREFPLQNYRRAKAQDYSFTERRGPIFMGNTSLQ